MASENFAGIDFDEIKEATALEVDEIKVLKLCFNLFDVKKQDFLGSDDLVSNKINGNFFSHPQLPSVAHSSLQCPSVSKGHHACLIHV